MSETELEMAERHVALGEGHIARQYEIIAELTEHGHATEQAKRLLDNLLDIRCSTSLTAIGF